MLTYIDDPVSGMDGLRAFKGMASKITIHTTETDVKPNWQEKRKGLPHYTLDGAKVYVHLPLNMAAYTMVGGTYSPNSDAGVNVQIEWVGFAKDSNIRSDEEYAALAELLYDISLTTNCPLEFPAAFPKDNSVNAHLSWEKYVDLSGVLGHCHAPWNTHWDPGALDIDRIKLLRPYPPNPTSELESLFKEIKSINLKFSEFAEAQTKLVESMRQSIGDISERLKLISESIPALNESQTKLILEKLSSIRLVIDP